MSPRPGMVIMEKQSAAKVDGNGTTEMRKCKGECGRTLPKTEEHFQRNSKAFDGMLDTCRKCMSAKQRRGWKVKKGAVPEETWKTGPETASPLPLPPVSPHIPLSLTIDFTSYPEVLEMIKRIARDEERTPEAQVRYWIRTDLLLRSITRMDADTSGVMSITQGA